MKISPQNVDGSVISDEEYNAKRKAILEDKTNLLEQINRQKKYVIAIEDSTMNGIWEVSSYNTSATEFGCPPDKLKEVAVFLHQQSGKD